MKKTIKFSALILSLVMLLGVMCGCSDASIGNVYLMSNDSAQTASDLVGEWIDQENDSLVFHADGACTYFDGSNCESYDFDGKTVTFVYEGEELTYDARLFDNFFVLFFDTNTYTRVSGTSGELAGEWECTDEGYEDYSFVFEGNTFVEDGSMTGEFAVQGDELALVYSEDNTIAFNLIKVDGDTLYVSFGWPLEKSE